MMRATSTDGEFRVHVACRRSSRLSHTLPSTGPDPVPEPSLVPGEASSSDVRDVSEGDVPSEEVADCSDLEDCVPDSVPLVVLSPISEELGLSEASISPISGSSTLSPATAVLRCQDAIVDGGQLAVSSHVSPCLGAGVGRRVAEKGDASRDAFGAADGPFDVDGGRGGVDSAVGRRVGHTALCSAGSYGGGVVQGCGDGLSIDDAGVVLSPSVVPEVAKIQACHEVSSIVDSVSSFADSLVGEVGELHTVKHGQCPLIAGSSIDVAGQPFCASSVPLLGVARSVEAIHTGAPLLPNVAAVHIGGGMVREEGRDPPVAKEAVRPQPADGLRQLPRSSEEPLPVSEAETSAGGGFFGGVQTGAARGGI
ncbi:hypothetical protein Dimus_013530 [Dionaea muscipula]